MKIYSILLDLCQGNPLVICRSRSHKSSNVKLWFFFVILKSCWINSQNGNDLICHNTCCITVMICKGMKLADWIICDSSIFVDMIADSPVTSEYKQNDIDICSYYCVVWQQRWSQKHYQLIDYGINDHKPADIGNTIDADMSMFNWCPQPCELWLGHQWWCLQTCNGMWIIEYHGCA